MPRTKSFDIESKINEAVDLFHKSGYSNTSINDIVGELGINRASLYDTFGSKEQLFKLAIEKYRSTNYKKFEEKLNTYQNPKEGLRTMFLNALKSFETDKGRLGCLVLNSSNELCYGNKEFQEYSENNTKQFEEIIYSYLLGKSEYTAGISDLRLFAKIIYSFYIGILSKGKHRKELSELEAEIDFILEPLNQ